MLYIIICSNMQNITDFYVSRVHFSFETSTYSIIFTWKYRNQLFCQVLCQGMYSALMKNEVNYAHNNSCVS